MVRDKKKKVNEEELNPENEERKRLKTLAYTNNILSHNPATKSDFTPLNPSKTLIKHHGKDILKKSQRKNRYLFSFPGLFAPLSAGKFGELSNLASKNPTLYLDFPQGRMKLFGTIVYPQNRYLTLQFSRGGKNVMCEDCFDTMIVFSDACWVGKRDENPDEARLDFPKELFEEKHSDFDFKGGAGAAPMGSTEVKKVATKSTAVESPSDSQDDEMEVESPERHLNKKDVENITPVRQSGRTTGKKFNFAEVSSGEDSDESSSSLSGEVKEDTAKSFKSTPVDQEPVNLENPAEIHNSEGTAEAVFSTAPTSGTKDSSRSSLVQATISTLFKKVEDKKTSERSRKTASKAVSEKRQLDSSTLNNRKAKTADKKKVDIVSQDKKPGVRSDRKKQKAELVEIEDDIEELSSASEDIDGSDDDWQA